MKSFAECFTWIKEKRNLTAAEIANMSGRTVNDIFHWMNGKKLPADWKQVEAVIVELKLSKDEYKKLKHAYERTVLGEYDYVCYKKIVEILQAVEARTNEYAGTEDADINITENTVRLSEFQQLNNRMEIFVCLQKAIESLLTKEKQNLYLKFHKLQPEIYALLKMFCSQTTRCRIEEIVYFYKENNDYDVENLEVLKENLEMLIQKNKIEIYFLKEMDYEKDAAENWIISDDFLLFFDTNLTTGMFTTKRDWIDHFLDTFENQKKCGNCMGTKMMDELEYAKEHAMMGEGCSIEYMPCVGQGMDREILERHIYQEVPIREELIEGILGEGEMIRKNKVFWRSFFSKSGFLEFMETGRIENYPYMVYERPDLEYRCKIIQNCIDYAKKGRMKYYMIKEGLPDLHHIYIKHYLGDKVDIFLLFREGFNEDFMITDKGLQKRFWDFFNCLERFGYVYSTEETLAFMEEKTAGYQEKLHHLE